MKFKFFSSGNKDFLNLRSFLAKKAIGSFSLKVANIFLLLITNVLLANLLGARGFGIYSFAIAVITILAIPTQLGLPILIVRQVAVYHVRQEWQLCRGLLQRANQAVLGLSLITMAASGVVIWLFAANIDSPRLTTFAWGLGSLPLLALGSLRSATLRGLHYVILGQTPEMLIKPVVFIVLIGGSYLSLSQSDLTPSWFMAMNMMTTAVAFFLGAWWLLRYLPKPIKQARPTYQTHAWFQSALPLLLIGGVQVINSQTGVVMVGLLRPPEEVGIYRVAVMGASLVSFSLMAINPVLAPTFSQLYTQGNMVRLQHIVMFSARAIFLLSMPIALILILFSKQILMTFWGNDFAQGNIALTILCVGQLVNTGMGSVGLLLNMTGYEKDTAQGIVIATVLNLLGCTLLIPIWGIEGAAIASSVSLITWNILLAVSVKRRLKISSIGFQI